MSNFVDLFNEDKSDIKRSIAQKNAADRLSGSHRSDVKSMSKDYNKEAKSGKSERSKNSDDFFGSGKYSKNLADEINARNRSSANKVHRDDKSQYGISYKSKNESFHFGPSFEAGYLDRLLEENDDYSIMESTYDGSAINDDEDPTEPSVDDIVNAEPDLASNYHFGPAFGQDIFSKSTLKHSRK